MRESLLLHDLSDNGASEALAELRWESLRHILVFTAIGHFLWHTAITATSTYEVSAKAWILFPLVVGGELGTYRLQSWGHRVSASFFLVWALVCITATIWLFQASEALFLYPLLALVTAIVLHPLAGFLVVAIEGGLMALLSVLAPTGLWDPRQLSLAVLAAALTVLVSWALMHSLVVAVHWSLNSYEQARQSMRDAQEHRGKLVQALKQLDIAYHRLQRANAALAEAWRAAADAERTKTDFVTNISHELRTPLNLIIGFSEMMISAPETYGAQPLPREYRGDLHAIYRSAQHLLALTDDVLDLAQADLNRLALVSEPTDLAEVVRDALEMVREYTEAKGLELRLNIGENLPHVHLDRLRIRQVLLNLLINATRFTERGRISVTVARHGDEVLVSVADTGQGIPSEKIDRIFEDFHHIDETAAREHVSTGIGLAISRKFVELHHGRMWVESELGAGTTLRFALPIVSRAGDTVGPGRLWSRMPQDAPVERILVLAHEDRSLRHLLQRRLGACRVVSAPTMGQAMQLACELRAVAILADLSAPDCMGSPIPIIRCPLPRKHQLTHALGVADYLTKPVARADLRAALDRLGITTHRILIVDDDLRAVRLFARMIRASGRECEVLTAHNGDEALATMRAARPDLVILDLVMPGRSGQEVLDIMAKDAQLAALPVIVVSAKGPDEERLPLLGEIRVSTSEGLQMGEVTHLVEAILTALGSSRACLTAREPELAAGRSASPA